MMLGPWPMHGRESDFCAIFPPLNERVPIV